MDNTILLAPKKDCKYCWGRGWLRFNNTQNGTKEVRPCHCVKASVDEWPDPSTFAYQTIK